MNKRIRIGLTAAGLFRLLITVIFSILVCFAVHCLAADQPTVLVVAQDGSQIYYHQNGEPIDSEEIPKGTELTIESTSGERCFVTYKGKPAYIRRQLLASKQEFLDAQQKTTQQQVGPPAESTASTQQKVTATSTTNAVTKNDARADAIRSVIQNLKARADAAIESGHYHFIGAMFNSYDGDYAEETATERKQLATEYDEKATVAEASKQEETKRIEAEQLEKAVRIEAEQLEKAVRFEAEQKAKGLVQYEGRWLTPAEAAQSDKDLKGQERVAEQEAKGLVTFEGKWLKPQEVDQILENRRRNEEIAQDKKFEEEIAQLGKDEERQPWQKEADQEAETRNYLLGIAAFLVVIFLFFLVLAYSPAQSTANIARLAMFTQQRHMNQQLHDIKDQMDSHTDHKP